MAHYQPGTYSCEIVSQGFDESQVKKTPFFFVRFYPRAIGNEAVTEAYEREAVLYLTEKTVERGRAILKGVGWDGLRFSDLEPGGSCSFVGKSVELRCEHEQSGDNVYERWDFMAP